MLRILRDKFVEQIRQRVGEGDCPITPALSVEMLENIVVELADDLASAMSARSGETEGLAPKDASAVPQADAQGLNP